MAADSSHSTLGLGLMINAAKSYLHERGVANGINGGIQNTTILHILIKKILKKLSGLV